MQKKVSENAGIPTPYPWEISPDDATKVTAFGGRAFVCRCGARDEKGEPLNFVENDVANAQYIVKCVNFHETLLHLLGTLYYFLMAEGYGKSQIAPNLKRIAQVLGLEQNIKY